MGSPGKQRLSAFPVCLIPFPTPSSLGLPNRLLSLATGSRSLPTCCCGIHPLRGFPQGPFPKGCKLRNWRGYHSLDPSQAKGPQEGSQARAQLAGPRAGMTDAGILSGHLGPMNSQGEEQDEKDRPQLESRPGLSLSIARSFVFLLERARRMSSKREKSLFPVKHLFRKWGPGLVGRQAYPNSMGTHFEDLYLGT